MLRYAENTSFPKASFLDAVFSETAELVKLGVWGRTGFDVSGQRPVRRAEFAGDSLNAGS